MVNTNIPKKIPLMKNYYKTKTLFLALILISALSAVAQHDTIPNPGMENWTCPSYCDPNGWNTDNSLTNPYGQTEISKSTVAAHVHSGTYAATIASKNVIIQVAPGTITTGTINSSNQTISGGCAMNYRPLKFKLWYQYTPSGTDTFVVNFALLQSGVQIGYVNYYTTSTVTAWTQLSLPITYTGSGNPDQMQIIVASGTGNNSHAGSVAYVDDLSLVDCSLMSVTATPTAATCTQSNGSIVAAGSGTTGPYTYAWSNSSTLTTVSGLTPASYSVVATDADGCTASATASITTSNVPFTVGLTPTPTACITSTGSVVAAASAGTSPYTYAWSNTTTASSITNVAAASYTVTVTDSHGCSTTATATVTSNNVPFTVTPTNGTTSCVSNTGTVSVVASAGTQPYTYLWTNSTTASSLSSLGAGNYDVTVTDAHGCSTTSVATVATPNGPSATDVATNPKCHGGNTGSIVVTETGGTGNLTYLWSNTATTVSLNNVAAGSYSLVITDANNCSFAVSATLTEPAVLSVTEATTNVTCNGGSDGAVVITPAGGTSPYTTNLVAGGTVPVSALTAGTYSFVVIDNNVCTDTASFIITQPAAISLTSSTSTNVNCFGGSTGSINVTPTGGGVGTFAYAWSPNVSTTASATALAAGSYAVTATDANSCTVSASFTVTQPASAVTANVTTAPASSATGTDGSATVTASGGTGTFSYQWSNGGSAATITNLTSATYCVTVNDTHDCTVSSCDSVGFSVGINEINAALIKVYPNPANNQVTIETGLANGNFQLNIYSLDGKLVAQKTITGDKSIVMLNQLADGLYTYQLKETLSGGLKYGKLQIQR